MTDHSWFLFSNSEYQTFCGLFGLKTLIVTLSPTCFIFFDLAGFMTSIQFAVPSPIYKCNYQTQSDIEFLDFVCR